MVIINQSPKPEFVDQDSVIEDDINTSLDELEAIIEEAEASESTSEIIQEIQDCQRKAYEAFKGFGK